MLNMNNIEELNSFDDKNVKYNIQIEVSFDRKRLESHDKFWSHPKFDKKLFIEVIEKAIDSYQEQILEEHGEAYRLPGSSSSLYELEERTTFIAAYMNYKVK